MALYIVSHSDPESYAPTFLEGPEVENWEEYCNSLMPEIIERAIELGTKGNKNFYGNENKWSDQIREMEMSEATITVLKTKGYKVVQLPNMNFFWLGDWSKNPKIALHNIEAEIDFLQYTIKEYEEENDPDNEGGINYMKEKIIELKKLQEKHP